MKINKFKLTLEFQVSVPNRFSIFQRDIHGIRIEAVNDLRNQLIEAGDRNESSFYHATHIISDIKQIK